MIKTRFLIAVAAMIGLSVFSAQAAGDDVTWSINGYGHASMISPSGDFFDSGMHGLAGLQVVSINIPQIGLTAAAFDDPKKAVSIIRNNLFLPEDKRKRAEMTPEEIQNVNGYQNVLLNQAAAYILTLGLTLERNAESFTKRREQALAFIPTAKDLREDQQVLNGVTLGFLAETNKMLAVTAARALSSGSDGLVLVTDRDIEKK